jgi:hypothetical protein
MSVIADELHITIVIVVVRHYLSYHISTCSTGVIGGIPVQMYVLIPPRMAITHSQDVVTGRLTLGPTRALLLAEIIKKPNNPYVRVALEIGLYGTGTHGSVREAREKNFKANKRRERRQVKR